MYGMVHEDTENILFVSEDGQFGEETTEALTALTVDDFNLSDFMSMGMIISGTGIIVSLLVLTLLSIIRTR